MSVPPRNPQAGGEKGSGRVLLVVLPGLRGGAAEVEGGTACFWGIDFGVEAGLADSVWPGFPAAVAALGGFFVVGGDGGVGGVKAIQTSQRAAIFFSLDLCPVGPARMCRESYGWMSGIGSLRLRR
jgi:hypothetical protein